GLFGGNSNWRGPVWMPVNHLVIESLRKYHTYYGDTLTAEFPTGSGRRLHLGAIADELTARLAALFLPGPDGTRPSDGGRSGEPRLFHEYFHAETGRGLGASHQTGWTACIADLLQRTGAA
ncbi:MAG: MGH1-like glycoside hydrolase domain-containing protein, partial [Chthoniobacterales bacterium]